MLMWNSADAPTDRSAATCTDAGIRGEPGSVYHDLVWEAMYWEAYSNVPEGSYWSEKTPPREKSALAVDWGIGLGGRS